MRTFGLIVNGTVTAATEQDALDLVEQLLPGGLGPGGRLQITSVNAFDDASRVRVLFRLPPGTPLNLEPYEAIRAEALERNPNIQPNGDEHGQREDSADGDPEAAASRLDRGDRALRAAAR